MSDANAKSPTPSEFEEAKETARVYLRVVGVLDWDESWAPEYREREERSTRDAILKGWRGAVELPNDPAARHATEQVLRYLCSGKDDRILEALRDDMANPANHLALEFLKYRLLATGADMPVWLRQWEPNPRRVKGRWRHEAARNDRIGMVVEAMDMGSNTLVLYRKSERNRVKLRRDLEAVADAAEKPLRALPVEYVLETLNGMKARPWRKKNDGKGLTEADLVALVGEGLPEPAGIHAIVPDVEVRKHFPNLHPTSSQASKDKDRAYSLCDAVAAVLAEELPPPSDRDVERPWSRTVQRAWEELQMAWEDYCARHGRCDT